MCFSVSVFATQAIRLLFRTDPELIFDKVKLHEDGFQDVVDAFPKNFTAKQFRPELSGRNAFVWLFCCVHCCSSLIRCR